MAEAGFDNVNTDGKHHLLYTDVDARSPPPPYSVVMATQPSGHHGQYASTNANQTGSLRLAPRPQPAESRNYTNPRVELLEMNPQRPSQENEITTAPQPPLQINPAPIQTLPAFTTVVMKATVNTGGTFPRPQMRPQYPVPPLHRLGRKPCIITCHICHQQRISRMYYTPNWRTHFSAFVLCLVGWCCCACFVPYCMKSLRTCHHYCGHCKTHLGTTSQ